jgi:hypothetical protein
MAESNKNHGAAISESQRRKNELIAELARARSGISLHYAQVSHQSDVGRRLKSTVRTSFRHHIGPWLAGAFFTGGLISLLPAREKKVYVNPLAKEGRSKLAAQAKGGGGFFISLIRALVPILKPILTAFITKQLANVVGGAKEAQKSAERTTETAQEATETAHATTAKAADIAS